MRYLAAEMWPTIRLVLPWLLLLLGVLGSVFYSGSETGAYRLNRVRLRLAASAGNRRARLLNRMLGDMSGLIVVVLIGNNIANYLATAFATWLLHQQDPSRPAIYAELLATLIMAPMLFVFAEVLPKNILNTEADRMMLRMARPLWFSNRVFRILGLVALLKGISHMWSRLLHRSQPADPFPARARLRGILRESAAEGVVSAYQNELVDKILNLHQVTVSQAMVPMRQVATVPPEMSGATFRNRIENQPFSRYPVVDGQTGQVLGILPVHAILRESPINQPRLDLRQYLQPAHFVLPEMTITQALFALQRWRSPMAVVRNARGNPVGMVTAKDLVEEIVGELEAGM